MNFINQMCLNIITRISKNKVDYSHTFLDFLFYEVQYAAFSISLNEKYVIRGIVKEEYRAWFHCPSHHLIGFVLIIIDKNILSKFQNEQFISSLFPKLRMSRKKKFLPIQKIKEKASKKLNSIPSYLCCMKE